ncbi:glycosyltransferase family 2 protein [Flavobacterium ajazii]|uniref:glycosyltransferase family 2 protein n=1 Tax=Flavobacterium ajazii TaxID=2692318 RepID=UPI0013CF96E0|nr:glycosyltransferase family 2 protein [Flavobacterium ajazii]
MTDQNFPLLSIITVVYNAEYLLKETIESVRIQKKDWIEYIVIDGNSKDNTCKIAKEYERFIDVFISENDSGIYDAMNKGVLVSKGSYISFLNAGDLLVANFSDLVKNELDLKRDVISFGINLKLLNGKLIPIMPEKFEKSNFNPQHMYLPHPGLLVKKTLFDEIGLFNINYKSSGDLEWINRMLTSLNLTIAYVKKPLVIFLEGGVSQSIKAYSESKNVAVIYGKSKVVSNWIFIKQILKFWLDHFFKSKKS